MDDLAALFEYDCAPIWRKRRQPQAPTDVVAFQLFAPDVEQREVFAVFVLATESYALSRCIRASAVQFGCRIQLDQQLELRTRLAEIQRVDALRRQSSLFCGGHGLPK